MDTCLRRCLRKNVTLSGKPASSFDTLRMRLSLDPPIPAQAGISWLVDPAADLVCVNDNGAERRQYVGNLSFSRANYTGETNLDHASA